MKYRCTDPKLLNRLVEVIDGETSKDITIRMRPDIPEFLERLGSFERMPRREYDSAMDKLGIYRNYALVLNYPIYEGIPSLQATA